MCQDCLDCIWTRFARPQCVQCGERLLPAQLLMGDGRCRGCRDFEPEFDRAVSFGEYAGELRGLIHLLKYDKRYAGCARPRATCWPKRSSNSSAAATDFRPLIVPVPLHASKRSERGFNQAELIVRAAVKHLPQPLEIATVAETRNGPRIRRSD